MNQRPVSVKETDFLYSNDPEGFNRPPSKDGKCSQALGGFTYIEEGCMCKRDARLGKAAAGGWILESLSEKRAINKKPISVAWFAWMGILVILMATLLSSCSNEAWAQTITTECSYYTLESTRREGTGCGIGLTASGEILKDEGEYTAAHPTLPFGTRVRITRVDRKELFIIVRINDRGPAARLRRLGRSLDLNLSAAMALGIVKSGVAMVEMERIKQ
jgi:hypothetical protein